MTVVTWGCVLSVVGWRAATTATATAAAMRILRSWTGWTAEVDWRAEGEGLTMTPWAVGLCCARRGWRTASTPTTGCPGRVERVARGSLQPFGGLSASGGGLDVGGGLRPTLICCRCGRDPYRRTTAVSTISNNFTGAVALSSRRNPTSRSGHRTTAPLLRTNGYVVGNSNPRVYRARTCRSLRRVTSTSDWTQEHSTLEPGSLRLGCSTHSGPPFSTVAHFTRRAIPRHTLQLPELLCLAWLSWLAREVQ